MMKVKGDCQFWGAGSVPCSSLPPSQGVKGDSDWVFMINRDRTRGGRRKTHKRLYVFRDWGHTGKSLHTAMLYAIYLHSLEDCEPWEQSCCVVPTTLLAASGIKPSIQYLLNNIYWMNEFPLYFVTLHYSVSSYFSQISFSDLYFFLCPFCTTLHRVLSSFSYFSLIKLWLWHILSGCRRLVSL